MTQISLVRRVRDALLFGLKWRYSMFWVIVPTMFLASCAGAALMVTISTYREDARLRRAIEPSALRQLFEQSWPGSAPLLEHAMEHPAWCEEALHVVSGRVLTKALADRAGDDNANGFFQSVKTGRLAVWLHMPDGRTCRFGSDEVPVARALLSRMEASARGIAIAKRGAIEERSDGWISIASAAPLGTRGPIMTVGLYMLSPGTKLLGRGSVFRPLAKFILCINVVTALVLVVLLIRRIRRANLASEAWSRGELAVRINDRGRDEFSRLTHQFDRMADAMAGVIEIKQALAAAEERDRLARDLHDSAKQRAFALNLQLSAARRTATCSTESMRLIDAALLLTGQLQDDLAGVIRRLAAPTIAESGFRHVVEDGVGRLLAGSTIQWSVSLDAIDEAAVDAAPDIARQLTLITIEAVSNALKHAQCRSCTISASRSGAVFIWRIVDDGRGMPPSENAGKGMGLASMWMRAASLPDGTFDIHPTTGGGTSVVVTFKLL